VGEQLFETFGGSSAFASKDFFLSKHKALHIVSRTTYRF
jgi:hypothetical protein